MIKSYENEFPSGIGISVITLTQALNAFFIKISVNIIYDGVVGS